MIGRTLSNRYAVKGVVGRGGMAIVFKAYDKITKKIVAIKVLRTEYETDADFVKHFEDEAIAASKVSHKNIVNTIDVGKDGPHRYIVMEFVNGVTLKDMIRQKGRIEPHEAMRIVNRILAGVDHAHNKGIIHRDIKPQNILVDDKGNIKVADFGIARLNKVQDNEGEALGSVHYFSPEQAQGLKVDERSDLYSVGVVLYEMLTGVVPFEGTNDEIAVKHVVEKPSAMPMHSAGVSTGLEQVVLRALSKDPQMRYQSAAEMAHDLNKAFKRPQGGFVKYPTPTDVSKANTQKLIEKQKSDFRLRVILGVTAVCLLLSVGFLFLLMRDTHVEEPPLNCVGLELSAAKKGLAEDGISFNIQTEYNEEYPKGIVIRQEPSSEQPDALTLTVSIGSAWYELEDYRGQTEQNVRKQLGDLDACHIRIERVADAQPAGTVIAQSREPGRTRRDEETVLTVSSDPVQMPALIGLTLEGTTALLESEGLRVGQIAWRNTEDMISGLVLAQGIETGETVPAGTTVDIEVTRRDDEGTRPETPFTFVVPLDGLLVEIVQTAPSGEAEAVLRERFAEGTHQILLRGREKGVYTLEISLNGIMFDRTTLLFA